MNRDERLALAERLEDFASDPATFSIPSSEECREAAAALRQSSERDAVVEWRSIETAPKDGRRILAVGGGLDQVEIVSYNGKIGCWDAETCTLDDYDDEAEGYSRPAYWMPLPDLTAAIRSLKGAKP